MFAGATIVFDLDGTLVDTAPDLTNALNDVLARRGHEPVSIEVIRGCVGHGAQVMIEQALARAGAEGDVDRMLAEFLTHYETNIARESRPYPGAIAALDRLAAQGARLAICTNKRESLSRLLIQQLEIEHYFTALAGRDTFPVAKPHPGHLTGTIALAGGDPSRSVMIGDSDIDLRTAKAAAVPAILVSFGYGACPLDGFAPEAVIDHFDQLDGHAARLLDGGGLAPSRG
ncbi:MAG TPA: HAD-IA family hydrolase [Methyloceanibacter sp.]|jgi:phosphoglycolate phosphatase|nr:HAD-IA family hydrolase [Methyloceanibacter sp.]